MNCWCGGMADSKSAAISVQVRVPPLALYAEIA